MCKLMAKLDELISSLNGTPFQIAGFVRTSDSVECQYFGPEDLKDTVMDSVLKNTHLFICFPFLVHTYVILRIIIIIELIR